MGRASDSSDKNHQRKDGWNMLKPEQNNGIDHRFQLVQEFSTIHRMKSHHGQQ